MIQAWEAKLRGDSSDAEARFDAARELAATRGFRYMPVARVAQLPTEELLQRVEAVSVSRNEPDRKEATALLGAEAEPRVTVSRALTLDWSLAKAKSLGKSPAQIRKWEYPIKQAIRDFIEVVGDKPMSETT